MCLGRGFSCPDRSPSGVTSIDIPVLHVERAEEVSVHGPGKRRLRAIDEQIVGRVNRNVINLRRGRGPASG